MTFIHLAVSEETSPGDKKSTASNADIVIKMYADFASGNVQAVLDVMDPKIEWNKAENFPYADGNPYIGPDAVVNGVFAPLGAEWEYLNLADLQIHEMADNKVLATGRYQAKFKENGNLIDAQYAHLWKVKGSKVVSFQ
jgi:ketosteroid isomerase-like protein